jgi:hypothetical protein
MRHKKLRKLLNVTQLLIGKMSLNSDTLTADLLSAHPLHYYVQRENGRAITMKKNSSVFLFRYWGLNSGPWHAR